MVARRGSCPTKMLLWLSLGGGARDSAEDIGKFESFRGVEELVSQDGKGDERMPVAKMGMKKATRFLSL